MALSGKKRYSQLRVLNYNEIQNPRKRKGIIDFDRLVNFLGFDSYDDLIPEFCMKIDEKFE